MSPSRVLCILAVTGALAAGCQRARPAESAAAPAAETAPTMAELRAEVDRLKSIAPTQSHVMADTAVQAASLWFAAEQRNWPLAMFYFNETRGRIRWTVRINPTPKVAGSEELVDLQGIFDGIDDSVLTPVKQAITDQDVPRFEAAYRVLLETCYSCHKSAGRPYLRPMIPTVPAQPIINPDPGAQWPR